MYVYLCLFHSLLHFYFCSWKHFSSTFWFISLLKVQGNPLSVSDFLLKEHIPCGNPGTDDDISIVLELPENDNLFERKKVYYSESVYLTISLSHTKL